MNERVAHHDDDDNFGKWLESLDEEDKARIYRVLLASEPASNAMRNVIVVGVSSLSMAGVAACYAIFRQVFVHKQRGD